MGMALAELLVNKYILANTDFKILYRLSDQPNTSITL